MGPGTTARVTPDGVRDGDPGVLSALTERRGGAVLAYAERLTAPGRSVEAAADALGRFRTAVVAAGEADDVDPERLLLHVTRCASAARAERPRADGGLLQRRGRTCALVPDLLVARAEGTLTPADRERLDRHLERCGHCRATRERFRAAERAYREA